ncbi:hypothetical protein EAX61_04290 [Dokdonia sinensis]|uniref:POTRA domain-containing protein n=1 Tax=Dokdonia sinensis TaxID=2479847 RepID=A0A3M0GD58_9FLAO|nr:hypothetical protein [Dokdonia sinensis]RMB62805.1 hypothetical protein EAX61_04290 [Dokdonia sinensis]
MKVTYNTIFVLITYAIFLQSSEAQELNLKILGYTDIETEIIDSLSYQRKHQEYQSISQTIEKAKNDLVALGYYDTKEIDRKNFTDNTYSVRLHLGNRFKRIILLIDELSSLPSYLKGTGYPIQENWIDVETAFAKALLEQLTIIAANKGKPFSSFQIQNISKRNDSILQGELKITEDTIRNINNIIIQGYDKMPMSFIKRYAGLKSGTLFNRQKLLEKQEAINNLPFVTVKKDLEIQFTKDSTNVYLYLNKQRNNSFDGFLGFSTDETNNLILDGYLDLVLRNNLNYGESLILNYKSDGNDQSQLKVSADLPYLFGSPLGVNAELYLFRKDTTFSETTQQASLYYQASPRIKINTGYQYKTSDNLLDIPGLTSNISDYTSNRGTLSLTYAELSSNVLFPERRYFFAQGEMGQRNTTDFSEQQLSFLTVARNIFKLNDTNAVYIQSATQILFSDSFVTNELYRFGGITSIRGFEENSIFANLFSVLNTEYRYTINPGLYVHSILDVAYFENELIDAENELISFGFGAGLNTKAGLFKINIANGKSDGQEFKFSNTKVHLQLQAKF